MNKISILFFVLVVIMAVGSSCKRNDDKTALNITLYNQPLDKIEFYIQGKWRYVYGKGGICGSCLHSCNNCSIEFIKGNKVKSDLFIKDNTTFEVEWKKEIGYFTRDSTFVMMLYNKGGYSGSYFIDKIYNDTLIIHDYGSDPIFHHFVKWK